MIGGGKERLDLRGFLLRIITFKTGETAPGKDGNLRYRAGKKREKQSRFKMVLKVLRKGNEKSMVLETGLLRRLKEDTRGGAGLLGFVRYEDPQKG